MATLAAISGCASGDGTARSGVPPVSEAAGEALPQVPLVTLENRATRLDAEIEGRPALVSFWATWCDACSKELGALDRLGDRARSDGGVVIGVAVGEPRATAAEFVSRHRVRFPQLVDEGFALTDALGQRRLPTTLVVDRHGRVVFTGGALDERALAAFREALRGPG